MRRIYLDYAASTPVWPEVLEAMQPYFGEKFGNVGSLHYFGQEAMAVLDSARGTLAQALGAGRREIIFTGSATEANNLALRGVVEAAGVKNPKIIISSIEHKSVLETARNLEKDGIKVVYLPVDSEGVVDLKKLEAALDDRTVLVSVMYVQNEIGTVEPIKEVANIIREFRMENSGLIGGKFPKHPKFYPLFHSDAAQAFQFFDCDVSDLGVDLMTLSAHKIYGPKGIGTLYVREEIKEGGFIVPVTTGGGQEYGLRSGTENVPLAAGFAEAVKLTVRDRRHWSGRIATLCDRLWSKIKDVATLNGPAITEEDRRSPSILNVYFPGHSAEEILTAGDLRGLAASSGAACSARAQGPSYVIQALGYPEARYRNSIRFSFGRPTTESEIDAAARIIKIILKSKK